MRERVGKVREPHDQKTPKQFRLGGGKEYQQCLLNRAHIFGTGMANLPVGLKFAYYNAVLVSPEPKLLLTDQKAPAYLEYMWL